MTNKKEEGVFVLGLDPLYEYRFTPLTNDENGWEAYCDERGGTWIDDTTPCHGNYLRRRTKYIEIHGSHNFIVPKGSLVKSNCVATKSLQIGHKSAHGARYLILREHISDVIDNIHTNNPDEKWKPLTEGLLKKGDEFTRTSENDYCEVPVESFNENVEEFKYLEFRRLKSVGDYEHQRKPEVKPEKQTPKKQTPKKWLLFYDDPDIESELFTNKDAANRGYNHAKTSWSCHLFETIESTSWDEQGGDVRRHHQYINEINEVTETVLNNDGDDDSDVIDVAACGYLPWDGGEMPFRKKQVVEVLYRDGGEVRGTAGYFGDIESEYPVCQWTHHPEGHCYYNDGSDIIGYRLPNCEVRHGMIVWQGGKRPVKKKVLVDTVTRCGSKRTETAGFLDEAYLSMWENDNVGADIIRFRISQLG